MKRNTKIFWRTFFISSVIVLCLYIIIAGIGESYKQMQKTGFGKYKNTVETSTVFLLILFRRILRELLSHLTEKPLP